MSWNFSDFSETVQSVRTLSRGSRKIAYCPETFQSVQKLSKVSGNLPDTPETFQSVQKLWKRFGKHFIMSVNLKCSETFKKMYILNFYVPTQKNSGLQKLSIKQCLNACKVFLTLSPPSNLPAVHRLPPAPALPPEQVWEWSGWRAGTGTAGRPGDQHTSNKPHLSSF